MITRSRSSPRKPHLIPSEYGLLHTPSSPHPPSHGILCTPEEDVSGSEISANVTSPCLCGGRSDENTSPDVWTSSSWSPPSTPGHGDPSTPPPLAASSSQPWSPAGASIHEANPTPEHPSYYTQPPQTQEHHLAGRESPPRRTLSSPRLRACGGSRLVATQSNFPGHRPQVNLLSTASQFYVSESDTAAAAAVLRFVLHGRIL